MQNLNVYVPTKEFYDSRQKPIQNLADLSARKDDSWINENNVSSFTIEVSGASTVSSLICGCINMTTKDGDRLPVAERVYTPLKAINLATLEVVDSITTNGLYQICSAGIPEIRLQISAVEGNVIIVGAGSEQ